LQHALSDLGHLMSNVNNASAQRKGELSGTCASIGFFCMTSRRTLPKRKLRAFSTRRLEMFFDLPTLNLLQRFAEKSNLLMGFFRKIGSMPDRISNWKAISRISIRGSRFQREGFPDFSPYVKAAPDGRPAKVNIRYTGNHELDVAIANKEFGFQKTPQIGYGTITTEKQ